MSAQDTLADRAGQLGKWFAEYAEHHKARAEQVEALPGSEVWAKVERNLERARFAYTLQDDLAALTALRTRPGMERAAEIAEGCHPDHSQYHEDSPFYGSDLNPDRTEFGRGKEAGRKEAAQAIRAAIRREAGQ